ncbi:hypothetical protein KUTeg_023101 [Tegillarca granosa]|uniref:Enoyl reductase (ER) domain-containing protein n=1 Tax=Tegillarca granosa TaxID=220873 RepID=A0ABQ9E3R0_TEGGR|nr:hypothetical protein KUTeg_023101 [Tegillarca granosa]
MAMSGYDLKVPLDIAMTGVPLEMAMSGYDLKVPLELAMSGYDLKVPLELAMSGYDLKVPLELAMSGYDLKVPLELANSGYDLKVPLELAMSVYDLKVPLELAMSGYDLKVPLELAMSGYDLKVSLELAMSGYDLKVPLELAMSGYDLKVPLELAMSGYDLKGLGEVVSVGSNTSLQVGQPVMYAQFGAFSDYKVVSERRITKIPKILPQFLPFQVSGATAAIALDKLGELKPGEKVLVTEDNLLINCCLFIFTAAAGGTGQFAKIGCDRPINYKKENLKEVLKTEYKAGIDVVYESVGGDTFEICFNSLATKGRLIVIGFIEGYESDLGFKPSRFAATLPVRVNTQCLQVHIQSLQVKTQCLQVHIQSLQVNTQCLQLLNKSASIKGFFLEHFRKDWQTYVSKMSEMYDAGKLKSFIDLGENTPKGPFVGLEKVNDAVEHLYTKNSVGKIMVDLSGAENSKL